RRGGVAPPESFTKSGIVRTSSLHLSPLRERSDRVSDPGEGDSPHTECVASPPHPTSLRSVARGEGWEPAARQCVACTSVSGGALLGLGLVSFSTKDSTMALGVCLNWWTTAVRVTSDSSLSVLLSGTLG